jgi:aspartate/methionine/tyrosine aminotransferase
MGIGSPDLRPSQSVIDAVKLALKMKMHINTELSGIARIAKSMADFI